MIVAVYDRRFPYIPSLPGNRLRPQIPIRITYRGRSTDRLAIVDSGADLPFFPKTAATLLGIDLSALQSDQSQVVGGMARTWQCLCDITVEGVTQRCNVAIVDDETTPYLLGRTPFFQLLQIGFRESQLEFYLAFSP